MTSIKKLEKNDKDPKFRDGDRARKSKCKNIFAQGHIPNWSEKVVIKKLKLLFDGHMLLEVLLLKELLECFTKTKLEKINETEFRIEKVINRKRQ